MSAVLKHFVVMNLSLVFAVRCLLDKFSIASDPKGDGSLSWRVTKNLQDKLLLHLLVLALKVINPLFSDLLDVI